MGLEAGKNCMSCSIRKKIGQNIVLYVRLAGQMVVSYVDLSGQMAVLYADGSYKNLFEVYV